MSEKPAGCECASISKEPTEHEDTCPFKIMHTAITASMPLSEEELLGGLFLLSRLNALDHALFLENNGQALHDKFLEGVKIVAALKATGKVPEEFAGNVNIAV